MRRIDFTSTARRDIAAALRTSRRQFGDTAVARYSALLKQAYADLRADPERAGVSMWRNESRLGLYHLRHARSRLPSAKRVGAPRHIIAFKADTQRILIVRVLHDSMDIDSHLDAESDNDG
ncbi:MAG: type II toxin-antitoxin system RelE/ParE family toxin [Pseudomonadota bacterium]